MSRQVIIDHYFGSPIFPFDGRTKKKQKKTFLDFPQNMTL